MQTMCQFSVYCPCLLCGVFVKFRPVCPKLRTNADKGEMPQFCAIPRAYIRAYGRTSALFIAATWAGRFRHENCCKLSAAEKVSFD
jgi:hypothetical protein